MATIATELIEAKRDERGRRITPKAERAAMVRAYEESGLTQKAFAERECVKYATFVSWVQTVRREAEHKIGFAEVSVSRPATTLEVQLADGIVIRGSNVEDVARLLRLVRC